MATEPTTGTVIEVDQLPEEKLPTELDDQQMAQLYTQSSVATADQIEVDDSVIDSVLQTPTTLEVDNSVFNEVAAEQEDAPTPFQSYLMGSVSGATMRFADEIAGGIESVLTDKSYKQARDNWRKTFKQAEQANPKSFIAGEITGGVATAFTPVGWAGAGLKGAIAAGAVGGAVFEVGGSEAETAQELAKEALKGAALGGATAGVLGGIIKVAGRTFKEGTKQLQYSQIAAEAARNGTPITRAQAKHLANFVEDNSEQLETLTKQFLDKGHPVIKKEFERLTPQDAFKQPKFAKWLLFQDPSDPFKRAQYDQAKGIWSGYNNQQRNQVLAQYREHLARQEAARTIVNRNEFIPDPLKLGFLEYFRDPMFKGMDIDRVYGTNIEGIFNGFTTASNQVANTAAPFLKRVEDLQRKNRKIFKGDESQKLMQWLDGQKPNLTDEQLALAKEWRGWFDDIRDTLGSLGLKVEKKANYFPQKMADKATLHRRLRQRYDRLAAQGGAAVVNDDQLMKSVMILGDGAMPEKSSDVLRLIESLKTSEYARSKLGRVASAAFERRGDLPDIVREFDVERAALNYLSSNLKAAYFDKPLRQLHSNMLVLRGLGAEKSARYLDHYMRRMSGEPSNAHALLDSMGTRWKIHWKDWARKPEQAGWRKQLGEAAAMAPDFLGWASSQIYPNLLGWNPYAPIRNMTQTWLVTAPEIGGGYGQKLTGRGWRKALLEQSRGTSSEEFLRSRNLIADQFTGESARKAVEEGIGRVPGVQFVEKMSKLGMAFYSKSDTQNRWFTWHIGQELGEDLLKGVAKAKNWAGNLPPGIKQQLNDAQRRGAKNELKDLISEWLIRKTQFNYGRPGLSQFGQDYGKLVSMFMKWGVMVSNDMIDMVRHRKDMEKVAAPLLKYMAPMAVLMAGDGILEQMKLADDPTTKLIIGRGLTNASPVNSVLSVGVPPLISTPLRTLHAAKTALDGELEKAGEQFGKAVYPFLPGVGALPKITDTSKKLLRMEENE